MTYTDNNYYAAGNHRKAKGSLRQRGFTLIEALIVMALILIMSAIAVMTIGPAMASIHVTNAYNGTLETLRQAHEFAIGNRHVYRVSFAAPGTATITLILGGVAAATPLRTMILPTDVQFTAPAGLPAIGPDSLGTGAQAIQFDIGNPGPATDIYFYPDGSARDNANNLNNGVVYIAHPGKLTGTRAITLIGAAGRLSGWGLNGGAWSRQ